ncbi:histidine phosphatase superfamily [Boeremia exigua]|uniref:histidine phosphatase superfamily n=1 Tax=Boeremia exigua TaxID=749465 RepID=UPI001E8D1235|nr:histidine phosphatase superfamily [Boeremia exigua]KAH6620165.1 histidine phosphatase superfamily [Boeremia exigua]
MSDQYALTPRVIIVRHGETDWAKDGRFTGITDRELTEKGEAQISSASATLVGDGKVIDMRRLRQIYVSPRKRAVRTAELLLPLGFKFDSEEVVFTEDIAEWNYGHYEGLKDMEIRQLRKEKGLDNEREWDIWTDGCQATDGKSEAGESPQQITERLDRLILRIKEAQKPCMCDETPADVLVVAHGLILRAFAKRWIGWPLDRDLPMEMQPGGVAVLRYVLTKPKSHCRPPICHADLHETSYKHNNAHKPALNLGLAL